MADGHRGAHRPADQVGEALEKRPAELRQLLETDPALSSTEVTHVEAHRSQFPCQDAFPNHPPSGTLAEPLGLNNLVDNIWEPLYKQERLVDPLPRLGDDVMCEILQYSVSLWDVAVSRARRPDIIPRNYIGDPLVLMNVSEPWSQLITSSPKLWSNLLIDTDTDNEDVLEYLQLFFLLSRETRLFIVLHGSGDVRDRILTALLGVGYRIDTLVYPPNVSRSTLARFQVYLDASHDQLEYVTHKGAGEFYWVIKMPMAKLKVRRRTGCPT